MDDDREPPLRFIALNVITDGKPAGDYSWLLLDTSTYKVIQRNLSYDQAKTAAEMGNSKITDVDYSGF